MMKTYKILLIFFFQKDFHFRYSCTRIWFVPLFLFFFYPTQFLFAQISVTVGSGTLQNSPTSYPAPYGNFYWGSRHQMIIRASELNALGVSSRGMTSVGFMVVTPSGIPLQNFTISMGTTSDSVLSTTRGFIGGMTQVYSVPTYTDVVGWNTHVFTQPFFWNGTNNLIIETCFNNTSWVNNGNAVVRQTDVGYNGTLVFRRDSLGTCTASPGGSIGFFESTQRPNIQLNFINNSSSVSNLVPTLSSCLGDTTSVTVTHPTLTGVANASLRMTYNPDSLTYVGFNSLNPSFSGMTISGGNGVVLMNWGVATNQTITAENLVNLRFRVNGSSPVAWDTLTSCEFSDENLNLVPQTFVSGSVTQNTRRFTWDRNICEGQSFSLSGQSYTTSGTYQGRRFGTGGACDTLITLNLNVIPRQTILPAVTRCSNQPYPFNGLSLTSSGTYFDTLINSLGCDSILQLNLTVNPAYNQNQSIVVCSGTSFVFGGQNLTTSGNYSHTYTTVNGCDSLVNLNLTIAGGGNQVTIHSSSNTNGFCPGNGIRIGLPNPIPNAFYRWKLNGNLLAGANSDTLYATQAGDYRMEIEVSPTCTLVSNTLTIAVLNCNRITGDLRYDNTNQTPLAGVPVHLKTLLGNIVASDTTDSAGVYDMAGYTNGNYVLDALVNYNWGGVTSADALLVTRAFNALISMSALRLKAGDVNMNNSTNGSDALLINRRVTGVINSFVAGNFTNNLPSVNVLGNPLVSNLRVLSAGDVNGSYAALPTAPILVLDTVTGGLALGTATVRFTTPGSGVFERGICWGITPNPTVSANKMVVGSGGYNFSLNFYIPTIYNDSIYLRAYARNNLGVYYSNEKIIYLTPSPDTIQRAFGILFKGNWCGPCGSTGVPAFYSLNALHGDLFNGMQVGLMDPTSVPLGGSMASSYNVNGIPAYVEGANFLWGSSAWTTAVNGIVATAPANVKTGVSGKLFRFTDSLIISTRVHVYQNLPTGNYKLALYVIENNVPLSQAGISDPNFLQQRVLRGIAYPVNSTVSTDHWGNNLVHNGLLSSGDQFLGTFVYRPALNLIPSINLTNTQVIIVVFKVDNTGKPLEVLNSYRAF